MTPPYKLNDASVKEERQKKYLMQKHFCHARGLPCFIFDDGICPFCKKNILDVITTAMCEQQHITGCPHQSCKRSYLE